MIHRLGPDDVDLLKELRLAALADDPGAFGSSSERELAYSDAVWRRLLEPDGNPTFVDEDASGANGMVVAARDDSCADRIWLVAMWVRPTARGSGVGDALVRQVLHWAGACSAPVVRLHVTEGNERAERLYARHGFVRTGRSELRERDGARDLEMEVALPACGEM